MHPDERGSAQVGSERRVETAADWIYPPTRAVDQVDFYHGVSVSDPYRWLEDDTANERKEWIESQNALTASYLSQIPVRSELRRHFEQLLQYPRYYDLTRRGSNLTFLMNPGLQRQLSLYIQRDWEGPPELLIDPTTLSADGTIRIVMASLSADSRYLAYGLSRGGADWQEYAIRDMLTGGDLPDRLHWLKATAPAWLGSGFYYSRYPEPAELTRALSAPNANHQVWFHRVGTPQSADILIYEDRDHPHRLHFVQTMEDESLTVMTIYDPASGSAGNAVWLIESCNGDHRVTPIITAFTAEFRPFDYYRGKLLALTNHNAPRWRVVAIDLEQPDERYWIEVLAEQEEALEYAVTSGSRLFACYLRDASHRLKVFDYNGRFEHEIELPDTGLVRAFPGQREHEDLLFSISSFTTPTTIYRYDIATRNLSLFEQSTIPFNVDDYETRQVFYRSKDGTQVPMFIVHRKGLVPDGRHRLLLYGYGGSGTTVGPKFDPLLLALLECDVIYASACLRGGGEYGEPWHRAGWRDVKQNVFDDCIAALEWLQSNGYTSADRCGLIGASNGGLLVGAVMTQRPDLLRVALPGNGPQDMLRFQYFTTGWAAAEEYGSSDDPVMFPILRAYSPLHNIVHGTAYPATLITTSEHDDHVVPCHSYKFAAMLQNSATGSSPYLIRIDTNTGHGPVSLPKLLDERADLYAFFLDQTRSPTDDPLAGRQRPV